MGIVFTFKKKEGALPGVAILRTNVTSVIHRNMADLIVIRKNVDENHPQQIGKPGGVTRAGVILDPRRH